MVAGIVGGDCPRVRRYCENTQLGPSLSPDAGTVSMPTLQIRKLRLREGQSLAQVTQLELASNTGRLIPLVGWATLA